ncbi:HAD-IIIC family phosphatase [uncultured Allofournierella sp.]|uniref:HAD-IIIC family phosphatase n=1 Tax=uncultured Allofournierella sp. TaxID=1940258 RepID=UPI003751A9BB
MDPFAYPLDTATILQKKRSLKRTLLEQPGLIEKKVALLSGSTIGEIKNILELFLLRQGIKPVFYEGGYGLFFENLVFDDGSLEAFAPDLIYIHTSVRNLKLWPNPGDGPEQVQQKLSAEYSRFEQAIRAALGFGCPVICNNFDLPVYRVMGNREGSALEGRVHFVRQLNQQLASLVQASSNLYLNDLAYLQALHGMDRFSSQTAWYAYKYAVSIDCIPYLCQSIANITKSLFGKNKKALALDLDNTLWGGIVGDDGPEGIVLGSESPAGMAYSEFQSYLKELSSLGVLLNVCSKNQEEAALSGLARADSVLTREDFICFKANWEPKSHNVAAMAKELNILPESIVFVDDNPAEREIVRQELPGVAVPEMTCPEEYIAVLDRSGYFEVTTLSADDAKRSAMYRQNLERSQLEQSFGDYNDYLKSLDMHCQIGRFDAPHAERITQLINKTNQFNLTTRRYTAAEISALMENPDYLTLYGRLTDRFGDNGLVTAIIGHREGKVLDLELWIMSCRTFKRRLEHAMFDQLVAQAKAMGIETIIGHYYPTAKNLLVRDFYATIGFEQIAQDDEGNLTFAFTGLADYQPQCGVMEIETVS